jgi:hypothetical protein
MTETTGKALFDACSMLVSLFTYCSTLKMETVYSSETVIDFHRNMRRYVHEDRILQVDLS